MTAAAGLVRPLSPMGSNFGDLDDDGFLDIYLGTGNTGLRDLMPNRMFRNDRGRRFLDVTTAGGFGHLQKGHAIAFTDLDGDGDVDVFAKMGGAFLGDRFYDAVFLNPGTENGHIEVRAVGTRSNRCSLGARIRADFVEDGVRRSVHRTVGTGGSFGGNPLRQRIGIGRAAKVDRLEVRWPATGVVRVVEDVPPGAVLTVTE